MLLESVLILIILSLLIVVLCENGRSSMPLKKGKSKKGVSGKSNDEKLGWYEYVPLKKPPKKTKSKRGK